MLNDLEKDIVAIAVADCVSILVVHGLEAKIFTKTRKHFAIYYENPSAKGDGKTPETPSFSQSAMIAIKILHCMTSSK